MNTAFESGADTACHFASTRTGWPVRRVDDDARFTDPETRCMLRLADATADFARRSSERPTFTAARICEALAFLSGTFALRRTARSFFVVVVTT